MENYLDKLNPSQRKAVTHTNGPLMVIAGAGSGKTRVLTFRIAYLMQQGVDPFNILALTFTNKAAREMKERIATIVGPSEAKNLWMGTFHSVFAKILRIEGHLLGYPSHFTIYDAEDARKAITNIIKDKNLDKEIYKPKNVSNRISAFKNNLITPKVYNRRADLQAQDAGARMPKMGEIYVEYTERCFRASAMDFDDLLLKTNELLYKFPEVLSKYQDRFKHILVDEYQDTNHAQYLIVKALADRYQNICVVGDDAQSIYAFRGANIRNILNFQKDYEDAASYKLEQNYRSTKNIVNAANSLIAKNQEQLEKNVWTENEAGEQIIVHKAVSDTDEANFVAQNIFDVQHNMQASPKDFAILYRTNAQSRAFEEALRRRNMPYRIYGGLSFYQRKEIKDLLSYLRLAINANDEEAFRRIINYPKRGIGQTTIERLTVIASEQKKSIWEICENIHFYGHGINASTQSRLTDFVTKIKSYATMVQEHPAFDVAMHVAKTTGLIKELADDKSPEGVSRYENLQELLNGIKDYSEQQQQLEGGNPRLTGYLEDIALLTDRDKDDDKNTNVTSLMTIHLAKGLEFPYVFIVGLEENLFPSLMATGSRTDLEEERRLFYVALTRAEKKAWLTYAHQRFRWGKIIDCEPSRFLEEIDEKYLDIRLPEFSPFTSTDRNSLWGDSPFESSKPMLQKEKTQSRKNMQSPKTIKHPTSTQRKLTRMDQASGTESLSNTDKQLTEGKRVIHDRFGVGMIMEITGEGNDMKATVRFDNAGEKKLLLKFAKLRRLG